VRKVIRPTQFYSLLLRRLRDFRTMDDGVTWSAQADFLARLADWDHDDPLWPLQRAERSALLELNVPLFTITTDGSEISDAAGVSVTTSAVPGLQRARERVRFLDKREIAWQTELIKQASAFAPDSEDRALSAESPAESAPQPGAFAAEADAIAEEITMRAVRRDGSAAWIGLNPVGDSDVSQLAVLGPDLYSGACGIAVFFAAHAAASQNPSSAELAIAAVAQLRAELRGRNAAHMARVYGIGGGIGLGSIVYGLTVISALLQDDSLLADAELAAVLIDEELIETDKRLDVMAGSAGAILGLLRLHRDTGSQAVLKRAVDCGEHLVACERTGPEGARSWVSTDPDGRALAGMSHGAAGFAYALSALAAATGREDFADAASECLRFERSTYDVRLGDWTDIRVGEPHFRAQWCHGAVGIGLARLAMLKGGSTVGRSDIEDALAAATRGWPGHADTLCCGAAGSVELFREAAAVLDRPALDDVASRRLAWVLENRTRRSNYRWKGGSRRFNVGLFRGLAGVGYTCLRDVDRSLPNILVWE
jgi:type 2 lantibiotic biosynthesis protein LanM